MKLLKNQWPCCRRATGFKADIYSDGDEVIKSCHKDGRKFKIKFVLTVVAGMEFLKMEWTEIGGRSVNKG